MTSNSVFRRAAIHSALLVAVGLAGAPSGHAQASGTDGGWRAWLGCWEVEPHRFPEAPVVVSDEKVCVLPAENGSGVETVSMLDGIVVERAPLDASGTPRPIERNGCSGWESTKWSEDGRRAFQRSEYQCGEGLKRGSTGILAMLPGGDWITVHAISIGQYTDAWLVRHRPIDPARVSAEAASALEGRAFEVEAARIVAASPLTLQQVIEASREVDEAAVEAWLIEQGQGFQINAGRLIALDDAGVPDRVIDLVVALSYPDVFVVSRSAREGTFRPQEAPLSQPPVGRSGMMGMNPWLHPGYGYGGYDRGYRGLYYPPPVIVVRDDSNGGGRMVKGQGYSQGGSEGESRSPSTSSGGSRPSPSSNPAPSSDGSSESPPARTGRTAQPRSGS